MKQGIKRLTDLRLIVIFSVALLLIIFMNVQKASAEVKSKEQPYLIKVNRVHNTITIYEKGEDGKYSVPIKAMVCSVGKKGTQTKLGTFQTKAKYRWKELMGKVYGQYSTRIVGGILFHSVYYYTNGNPATLATKEYNNLGSEASHGCIRLTVEDAKWIYDNCPLGTTVVVYDDKSSPGPLGKPEAIKLPSTVRWDPTDPDVKNPYYKKLPSISGTKNKSVAWGTEVDLLEGVKAKSSVGLDITSRLVVEGEINPYKSGDYWITYKVTDSLQRTSMNKIKVTVKRSKKAPILEGINDMVVKGDTVIDDTFAREGITASCMGVELNPADIVVEIKAVNELQYRITYSINVGRETIKYAIISIDKEAPVFTGIEDRILTVDQIPDREMALENVEVTDNYTLLTQENIEVTIAENPDGGYLVTYKAVDEFGNEVIENAKFDIDMADPLL